MKGFKTVWQVVLAFLFLLASLALVAGDGEIGTLEATLTLIGTGITGVFVSDIFEKFEWFQKMNAWGKQLLIMVVTFALPAVALLLLQYVPSDTLAALEPYWKWVMTAIVAWMGSQVGHKVLHKSS